VPDTTGDLAEQTPTCTSHGDGRRKVLEGGTVEGTWIGGFRLPEPWPAWSPSGATPGGHVCSGEGVTDVLMSCLRPGFHTSTWSLLRHQATLPRDSCLRLPRGPADVPIAK
jgi:hypothetical protein